MGNELRVSNMLFPDKSHYVKAVYYLYTETSFGIGDLPSLYTTMALTSITAQRGLRMHTGHPFAKGCAQ